ncbi:MAG: signal recognition particle-docking protein FtsY [Octadecabacter sp.]|nr:signal recognition particle-docking protein FtsY [Octadecabacter sp.]
MAFFKKLKDRMFKSSLKIEEGLDAIMEDGGVEEKAQFSQLNDSATTNTAAIEVLAQSSGAAEFASEQKPVTRVIREQAEQKEINAEEVVQHVALIAQVEADATEMSAMQTAADVAPAGQLEFERVKGEETIRNAKAETARQTDATAAKNSENSSRLLQAEVMSRAEEERLGAKSELHEISAKPGLIGRLFGRRDNNTVVRRELDDDMLERLEELLISADMGVDTALRVTSNMAEGRLGKRLSTQEIKKLLAAEITRIMEPVARPMPLYPTKPQVVLVVGVNGSGKTTTIGKLASQFQAAGKKVIIAAGDTFRAAAVEQLQVWGDRAGVPVLTAPEGSDPASLAYDAMEQAARDGADLLMIDTAGRLQNRADLMEELQKIVRVIRKKDHNAPHNTLLVLDATTGQNALSQVKAFQELADVTGLIMTKLDGTAKGGVLVALADKFGLPIHAIGVGEKIDDLAPFDPEDFAAALTGLDR